LGEKFSDISLDKFSLVAAVCSFCMFPISCASFSPVKLTEEFEFSNQSHLFCFSNADSAVSGGIAVGTDTTDEIYGGVKMGMK
ncbi:MAG: hypothetical protein JJE18_08755, partial [Eubacteriaceae bacterium]|nr:hypothetical protein [Eubacteriaceae bacterium]